MDQKIYWLDTRVNSNLCLFPVWFYPKCPFKPEQNDLFFLSFEVVLKHNLNYKITIEVNVVSFLW